MSEDVVLFHDADKLRVGGIFRYDIYLDTPLIDRELFLRVRNTELAALRAVYLNGPFTLYVDMVPMDYSEYVTAPAGAEPKYENHLKAGSHFSANLAVRNPKQRWRITVASEVLFSRTAEVKFEITIGLTKHASKFHGSKAKKHLGSDPMANEFRVDKTDTVAIWQSPLPRQDEPLHICVLTHGLVSNVTADMLYLKELIDQTADMSGENLICKGYTGNVCRTERGVKYLGQRVAMWLVDELIPTYKPAKLSFIAHSLGGLIQTYALGWIESKRPGALKGIELVNFIALASPFLGISHENPGYVQFALGFGVVGKTGRDLGLSWTPGTSRPLLERLPTDHTLEILRRFRHRTVYANAVHDGIVPLRTASLLYLDWRALGKASAAEGEEKNRARHPLHGRAKTFDESAAHNAHGKESHDGPTSSSEQKNSESHGHSNASAADDSPHSQHNQGRRPSRSSTTLSSSSSNNGDGPFSNFLFGDNTKAKLLTRYQTVGSDQDPDLVGEKLPKKTSLLESGMSLLLPPHPDTEFITDPSRRSDAIFHDRVYYQQDLPERRFKQKLSLKTGSKETVDVAKSEERIARQYHSGTSWRKVLVQLLPEAHNNIIVRRRFSNAYGWPVIHHVVREHFLFPAAADVTAESISAKTHEQSQEVDSQISKSSDQLVSARSLWTESDDEKAAGPDTEHDPHRASMFKVIPKQSPTVPREDPDLDDEHARLQSPPDTPEDSDLDNEHTHLL